MSAKNKPIAAGIFGCAGTSLSAEEKDFFSALNPFGFILFARNIDTPDQVKKLISDLRACTDRADAPVLVDQEGGRVQRLTAPHWRKAPPAKAFADLYATCPAKGLRALEINTRLLADDIGKVGFTVDCAPVVDVPIEGAHDIIGDRAYGKTPGQVADLARTVAESFLAAGIYPVVKHIPGHGRAMADSHHDLPHVDTDLETLNRSDFRAFKALADLPVFGMTAHVLYDAVDAKECATFSKKVIRDVIRKFIGFDGVLMSDDLSMKALSGSFESRTEKALAAGCDLVLHCNGDMAEMAAVAHALTPMTAHALARFEKMQDVCTAFVPLSDTKRKALDAEIGDLLPEGA